MNSRGKICLTVSTGDARFYLAQNKVTLLSQVDSCKLPILPVCLNVCLAACMSDTHVDSRLNLNINFGLPFHGADTGVLEVCFQVHTNQQRAAEGKAIVFCQLAFKCV